MIIITYFCYDTKVYFNHNKFKRRLLSIIIFHTIFFFVSHITNLPIKTKQAPKGACLLYHLIDI